MVTVANEADYEMDGCFMPSGGKEGWICVEVLENVIPVH